MLTAPDFERLVFEQAPNPDADESLAGILNAHARTDGIGQSQHRRAQTMHPMVEQVVVFASEFVDAIDVDRVEWVLFING